MANVLFFNSPLYGHVLPTLAVIEELVARGEQVTCYLTEEFAQAVMRTGARVVCYRSTIQHNRPEGRLSQVLVRECQYVLPQIIDQVRAERPDYIIYEEICLWGRILAEAFAGPSISCRASLAVNEHFSHIPHLLGQQASPAAFGLLIDTLRDLAPLADVCATYQLPLPGQDIDSLFFHAEKLNIVFVSRLIQPAGETFDERFVFVGAPTAGRSDAPVEARRPYQELQTMYVSLGTIYNEQPDFYRMCIQAFAEPQRRMILAVGNLVDLQLPGPIPQTVSVYRQVQQCAILQQAHIFVTHGGLNSLMEALYYGVPMIIIPQMPEQVITARRVVELGVGVMLSRDSLDIATLRDAAATLLHDDGLPARIREVQKEVQAAGGAWRAADAIQQFVSVCNV